MGATAASLSIVQLRSADATSSALGQGRDPSSDERRDANEADTIAEFDTEFPRRALSTCFC